ncbi:AraC family transcriptional regulator [Gloeocapsopsis sp. IPPAS B-1203]|uniref:helix-turn-helix transcriptional regulator n=1 Tax=Gloeocapsopsis sp. IPPAS B-1203 TaxID=2049454 RepID=UPI000C18DAC6|nr:AraC family transcriptional regulator [Gloeocapsopsis sp. IPPAS B-1203]PIG95353.1 AraC family transcriptional regulator [Gloeocapsopsis sp. IPPAS B-1203]
MTLFLIESEFHGQTICNPEAAQSDTLETPLIDPKGYSKGYRRSIDFCPELNLLIDNFTLEEDLFFQGLLWEPYLHHPGIYVECCFYLAGNNEVGAGENFLAAYPYAGEGSRIHWQGGQHCMKFDIHMDSRLFQTLVGHQQNQLPLEMRRVLEGKSEQYYFQHGGKTTSAMQTVLYQILHCPYQGVSRRLYLEAKAFELMALRLEQIASTSEAHSLIRLNNAQLDRLYHAKEILCDRLDNPPSLLELAREVGINHNKLKQGFRQVFGTTLFGYLHDCRMEKARCLLYQGRLTVASVANEVGYANAAKFASAFKRKFGITPSACRRGEKTD